ncbi:hypothetical protein EYF80_061533 [Liparis tanakae]|uniref:Uncharacterized protein n=1 Tax=Liparis tanakae TaxID=230148 RepID=A0A4Z2EHM2_9TELE|nr:hypothetical protein EYF80_061533 [Liparis tanakae]
MKGRVMETSASLEILFLTLQDVLTHLVHGALAQLPPLQEAGADRLHQLLQDRGQECRSCRVRPPSATSDFFLQLLPGVEDLVHVGVDEHLLLPE